MYVKTKGTDKKCVGWYSTNLNTVISCLFRIPK
jgi:hypothetical protein